MGYYIGAHIYVRLLYINTRTFFKQYWSSILKAVGLYKYLPIDLHDSLVDVEIDKPSPQGRELLVQVHAVAVNPVDTKMRAPQDKVEVSPRILGWDVAGVVEAVGSDVSLFKAGDEVFYAGSLPGPQVPVQTEVRRYYFSRPCS